VDLTPAHPTLAPASSTTAELPPSIEHIIGDLTAALATLVAAGLGEFKRHARLAADTSDAGGQAVAALLEIREATVGELDFAVVAAAQGRRSLRERDRDISDAAIATLVDSAVDIVQKIARLRLN
jgi:hypothetical protein